MKTSAAGLAALEAREGKRFVAYLDSTGVATIGVGHTGRMAPPTVHLGMTCTQAQVDAWLAADLAPVEAAINALGKKLTQNQFDACASLAFNIGVTGFHSSTVAHCISKGDMAGAADAFLHWEKPVALKSRREGERRQFLTADKDPMPKSVMAATQDVGDALKKAAAGSTIPPLASEAIATREASPAPVSAAAPAPAKPAPAPAAAAPAHPQAATKAPSMFSLSSLSAIASLVEAAMTVGHEYAAAAPALAKDAASLKTSGQAVVTDVTNVVSKIKAGHYADTATDIQKGFADLGNAISVVAKDVPAIASLVTKTAKGLPSPAGAAAVLSQLGKAA